MEPPRKKKRQSGKCKVCPAADVSDTSLVAWKLQKKVTKKCREMQETWTREQTVTSAGVAVVVAADVAPPKRPQGTARRDVKAPIGTTAAAQANVPRDSAGKQPKAPSHAMDAAQAKTPRGSHGEQANAPNGAAAAVQAIGPGGSDRGQAKAPRSAAAVAQETIPSEVVVARTLSRSGRVQKREILCWRCCGVLIVWWRMSGDASEVRGRGFKRPCTLGGGTCGMRTSGTGGRARDFCCCVLRRLNFSIRIPPGVCGGQGVQVPLYSRRQRLWYAYKRRAGTRGFFVCFRPCVFQFTLLPVCGGGAGGASASLLSATTHAVCIQAGREGERAEFVFVLRPLYFPFTFLPEYAGGKGCKPFSTLGGGASYKRDGRAGARERFGGDFGPCIFSICIFTGVCGWQEVQAPLYPRGRRLWYAYKRYGRAGARGFVFVLPPLYFRIYIFYIVWGGQGVQAPLYSRRRCLWYAYKRDRRAGARVFVFVLPPLDFSIYISPGVWGRQGLQALFYSRRRRLWFAYQWDGRAGARFFFVCYGPCSFPFAFLPLCRGQGVQELLYFRRRRLWHAYKRDGRAGVWVFLCASALVFFPFAYIRSLCRAGAKRGSNIPLFASARRKDTPKPRALVPTLH